MKFVYSPLYKTDIGPHVFPTEKYDMVIERLRAEGFITERDLVEPDRPTDDELRKIATQEYLDDLLNCRITKRTYPSEMPVKKGIIDAQILCCDGTRRSVELAREHGMCYHIGGGFHHAFSDHAEGFCYLNDVAFGAVTALEKGLRKVAVVDCDLHQGNGTAKFFENDDRVFTFSIHQQNLYPQKQRSDLDIGLPNGAGDEEYLANLGSALDHIIGQFKPELVIYVAGADPYVLDQLGDLRLTVDGLRKRDELVIRGCRSNAIPVAAVLAGGYAEDVEDTVEIHCNTARVMVDYDDA